MKIELKKVVTATYELYIAGETPDKEEMIEKAPQEMPLVYCHGIGMMLQAFEDAMEGKEAGDDFDFRIAQADAYGQRDEDGVITLDKKLFCIDGKFDDERVYEGAIIPMNTADGQVVKAQVAEVTKDKVTIDLNHPLAGEDLHFVGHIVDVRDVTEAELKALTEPHGCGGCGGCHGGDCGGDCQSGTCGCNGSCQ